MPAPHDLDPGAMTEAERLAKRRYQAHHAFEMDFRHHPPGSIVQRVRDVLHYDPATGIFVWRVTLSNRAPAGAVAGSERKDGYRLIAIDGQRYLAHRLAWLYVHGVWPTMDLDHVDRHPANNRLTNLRQATRSGNQQNMRLSQRSSVGLAGVSRNGRRWQAAIQLSGRQHHLGTFDAPEEAHAVYLAAKRELHPFHAFEMMPDPPDQDKETE